MNRTLYQAELSKLMLDRDLAGQRHGYVNPKFHASCEAVRDRLEYEQTIVAALIELRDASAPPEVQS
jgi:hypothetical protein